MFGHKTAFVNLALGIDLGHHAIKAVLLEETPQGLRVRGANTLPLPPDSLDQGMVVNRRAVARQLRCLLKTFGKVPSSAALALPTEQVQWRWVEMPCMSTEEMTAAAHFEVKKYLTYPVESAEVAIAPLSAALQPPSSLTDSDQPASGSVRALLTAAPRALVENRSETLEEAGLMVQGMEMEPLALLRAIHRPRTRRDNFWKGQSVGYLLLGSEISSMTIVQNDLPIFIRSLAWGGSRLSQSLAEGMGCTLEEAQAHLLRTDMVLAESGQTSWRQEPRLPDSNALLPELQRLEREIARLLNYFGSLYPDRSYEGSLSRLVICGGVACLPGLERFFANRLQMAITRGAPLLQNAKEIRTLSAEETRHLGPTYALACGLALGIIEQRGKAVVGSHREYLWQQRVA